MVQTFFPITPVEISHATDTTWTDIDVTSQVGGDAGSLTGVILQWENTEAGTDNVIAFRKNGSTDNYIEGTSRRGTHGGCIIGVDSNDIFEAYLTDASEINVYIVGYTMAGVTIATNMTLLNSAGAGFEDWDLSTPAPSATGILIHSRNSAARIWGCQMNGSTDGRTFQQFESMYGIIGCDANQIIELYQNTGAANWLWYGYVTDGATFNVNGTDESLATTGSYVDLGALPATAIMGFYEITGVNATAYSLRENGVAELVYRDILYMQHLQVKCDADRIVEGKVEDDDQNFYVVGYATAPAAVGGRGWAQK